MVRVVKANSVIRSAFGHGRVLLRSNRAHHWDYISWEEKTMELWREGPHLHMYNSLGGWDPLLNCYSYSRTPYIIDRSNQKTKEHNPSILLGSACTEYLYICTYNIDSSLLRKETTRLRHGHITRYLTVNLFLTHIIIPSTKLTWYICTVIIEVRPYNTSLRDMQCAGLNGRRLVDLLYS